MANEYPDDFYKMSPTELYHLNARNRDPFPYSFEDCKTDYMNMHPEADINKVDAELHQVAQEQLEVEARLKALAK